MAWPYSARFTNFVANSLPKISAAFLNAIQDAIIALFSGTVTAIQKLWISSPVVTWTLDITLDDGLGTGFAQTRIYRGASGIKLTVVNATWTGTAWTQDQAALKSTATMENAGGQSTWEVPAGTATWSDFYGGGTTWTLQETHDSSGRRLYAGSLQVDAGHIAALAGTVAGTNLVAANAADAAQPSAVSPPLGTFYKEHAIRGMAVANGAAALAYGINVQAFNHVGAGIFRVDFQMTDTPTLAYGVTVTVHPGGALAAGASTTAWAVLDTDGAGHLRVFVYIKDFLVSAGPLNVTLTDTDHPFTLTVWGR